MFCAILQNTLHIYDDKLSENDRVMCILETRERLFHCQSFNTWELLCFFKKTVTDTLPRFNAKPILQASCVMLILTMANILDKKCNMMLDVANTLFSQAKKPGSIETSLIMLSICGMLETINASCGELNTMQQCRTTLQNLTETFSKLCVLTQTRQQKLEPIARQRIVLSFLALYAQTRSPTMYTDFSTEVQRQIVIIISSNDFKLCLTTFRHPVLLATLKLMVHLTGYIDESHHPFKHIGVFSTCEAIQHAFKKPFTGNVVITSSSAPYLTMLVNRNDNVIAHIHVHYWIMTSISTYWTSCINIKEKILHMDTQFPGKAIDPTTSTFTIPASVISIFVAVVYALHLHNRVEFKLTDPIHLQPIKFEAAHMLFDPMSSPASSSYSSASESSCSSTSQEIPLDDQTWKYFQREMHTPVVIGLTHDELCYLYAFATVTHAKKVATFALSALLRHSHTLTHGKALFSLSSNNWQDWDVLYLAAITISLQDSLTLDDTTLSCHLCELFSIHSPPEVK